MNTEETQPQRNFAFDAWVRNGRPRKQWEKLVQQSENAIECCKRSGTIPQLQAEERCLALYLANEPKA